MKFVYQNVYGFAERHKYPMSGCGIHTSFSEAVETGTKAHSFREPYCGTLEYKMDGEYVVDVKFFPKLIG